MITKANYYGTLLNYVAYQSREKRLPNVDLEDIPEAYTIYQNMVQAQKDLDEIGFAEMPDEAYQSWLKSVAQEAQKNEQTSKFIQQNL